MPVKHSVFEKIGKKFTVAKISKRVQEMAVSAIKEMSLLAMDIPNSVNLAWGLPSFETPAYIREKISKELLTNPLIGKYAPPPGLPLLKSKIGERLEREKGITLDPQAEIMITAGAMQALMITWMTILEPGNEVLVTTPGFSSHYEQITLAGGVPVGVPLIEEVGWQLDLDAFKKAVSDKTRAVVICNPANPTGSLFPEQDLRKLTRFALEHDLFIVTDDPYEVFVYNGRKPFHILTLPEARKKVISCFSFSKEFAMTGWRVGYVLAEEGIINQMLKVQDSFVICAPHISQLAAITALDGPYEPTRQMVEEMKYRRDLICDCLDRTPDLFSYHKPGGAYYIFPRVLPDQFQNSVDFCIKLLKETGVVIVPGSGFGPLGEGHIRMSYCIERDEITDAFDRIERWWRASPNF